LASLDATPQIPLLSAAFKTQKHLPKNGLSLKNSLLPPKLD